MSIPGEAEDAVVLGVGDVYLAAWADRHAGRLPEGADSGAGSVEGDEGVALSVEDMEAVVAGLGHVEAALRV